MTSLTRAASELMLDRALTVDSPIVVLTSAMAAGNEDAYREFHGQYFSRLFRYIMICVRGDELAARDAVQDTLLRVVRHVRRFEDQQVFWDWLTVLARSPVADAARRRTRYVRLLQRFEIGRSAPEVLTVKCNGEMHEVLAIAILELPAEDQSILARKYEDGVGVREIAAECGASESAIESRLVRIRRQLRTLVFRRLKS